MQYLYYCKELLLEFNASKSFYAVFVTPTSLPQLCVGSDLLEWSSSIKYLGVGFTAGKYLKVDFVSVRHKCYTACNSVFSNCYGISEMIQLQLQELYCLPLLTYAFPALNVNATQIQQLNVCWNCVYRKKIHYNKWESVKRCVKSLGHIR